MRNLPFLLFFLFIAASCANYKANHDYVFPTHKGKAEYIKAYNQTLQLWDV